MLSRGHLSPRGFSPSSRKVCDEDQLPALFSQPELTSGCLWVLRSPGKTTSIECSDYTEGILWLELCEDHGDGPGPPSSKMPFAQKGGAWQKGQAPASPLRGGPDSRSGSVISPALGTFRVISTHFTTSSEKLQISFGWHKNVTVPGKANLTAHGNASAYFPVMTKCLWQKLVIFKNS